MVQLQNQVLLNISGEKVKLLFLYPLKTKVLVMDMLYILSHISTSFPRTLKYSNRLETRVEWIKIVCETKDAGMKITKISNPLTVIGVFATLTEIVGCGVLPLVPETIQSRIIWFVIGFPILLVCAFFFTLNFSHKVLYAPIDYQSDSAFLEAAGSTKIKQTTIDEKSQELEITVGSVGIGIRRKK